MPLKTLSLAFSLSAAGFLTACTFDDDDDKVTITTHSAAIISTVASDYSGSDVQVVDLITGGFNVSSGILPSDQSDFTVVSGSAAFYHIGKYNIDTISRYSIDDTAVSQYTYSVKNDAEDATANPYTIVEFSDTKAFVVRYNSDKVWVVNPTAAIEADFKIGEIDLSAYNDGGNDPEAFGAVIIGNKLFVGMQRLDNYAAVRNGSIAVFDVNTLAEIDTDTTDAPSNLKGIELTTRNPYDMAYHNDTGLLIASGDDFYSSPKTSFYSGIEKINVDSYENSLLIDDGTSADPKYSGITTVSIVDSENAFFIDYGAGGYTTISSLYHFNPSTGIVTGKVSGFSDLDLSVLATDSNGQTWVGIGDAANPRIHVLAADQSEVTEISLIQNPNAIVFVTE